MKLQGWDKLYQEIAELLSTNITEVNWIDLWHNQVAFLTEEHPFPTPAIFLGFRILNTTDLSEKVQSLELQVDVYYFYETFLDTYKGAYNQDDALAYLKTISDIYKLLHASSGENYAEMHRSGFNAIDTGGSANLYLQTFTCSTVDATALKYFETVIPGELDYQKGQAPELAEEPLFKIPLTGN